MISGAQLKFLISGQFLPDYKSDLDFLKSKTFFFSCNCRKIRYLKSSHSTSNGQ